MELHGVTLKKTVVITDWFILLCLTGRALIKRVSVNYDAERCGRRKWRPCFEGPGDSAASLLGCCPVLEFGASTYETRVLTAQT